MDSTTSTTRKSLGPTGEEPEDRVDLLCLYQRKLSSLFRANGYGEVRRQLLDTAREQIGLNPKTVSWAKLVEFGGGVRYGPTDWLTFYLSSMDRGFLQALIEGQIGRRMFEDDVFKFHVNKRHKLKETPQVYVNICSRVEFSAVESSQAFQTLNQAERRKWAGWGLAPKELARVLGGMEAYLKHKTDNPTAKRLARAVDACMVLKPGSKLSDHARSIDRRYLSSQRSIDVIQEWVYKLEEPVPWCFQEIGFGQHGAGRGSMHVFHDGTNYLFGLFTACAMTLYPKVFEIKTFAVIDVFHPEHADPCEILGSLCGGTYGQGQWMGLNPTLAGGNNMAGENGLLQGKLAAHFEKNRKDVGDSGIFERNWDEDQRVQERFDKVCNADLKKLESEVIELRKKNEKVKEELRKTTAELEEEPTQSKMIADCVAMCRSGSLTELLKRKSPPEAAEDGPKAKSARTGRSD